MISSFMDIVGVIISGPFGYLSILLGICVLVAHEVRRIAVPNGGAATSRSRWSSIRLTCLVTVVALAVAVLRLVTV